MCIYTYMYTYIYIYIYRVNGGYKTTTITGGPHLINVLQWFSHPRTFPWVIEKKTVTVATDLQPVSRGFPGLPSGYD